MSDKTYCGWSNYETWAVHMWMTNDEGSDCEANEMAYEALDYIGDEDAAENRLARILKEQYEESMPEVEGVWADLLGAALQEVNWDEIARALIANNVEAWMGKGLGVRRGDSLKNSSPPLDSRKTATYNSRRSPDQQGASR